MPLTPESSADLEARLARMELLTTIAELESCLRIYAYLMIFGKTTPAGLRESTGISKATVFRHLALLSKAGLVDKVEDPSSEDRRFGLHYFVAEPLMEVARSLHSKQLEAYAKTACRTKVLEKWLGVFGALPFALSQLTTSILLSRSAATKTEVLEECHVVAKMLAFRLREAGDFRQTRERIQQLLTEWDSMPPKKRRDWKKPMHRPMTLLISVVALDPPGAGQSVPAEKDHMMKAVHRKA